MSFDSFKESSGEDRPGLFALVRQALAGSQRELTELPLRRAVFLLAVPMVLEMAMESLFVVADIFWVSKLGADAVATVGLTESLIAMVYALAVGLSTAATATVARRIGERDVEGASAAAGQVLLLALVVSIGIGVLGAVFGADLLRWMGSSAHVIAIGARFTRIMLAGSVSVVLLFVFNAVFRGAGDAMTAMRSLWLANFANIVLGPLFIFGAGPVPAFGVTGAAIGTTLGRSIGVLYQVSVAARGRGQLRIGLSQLRPRREMIGGLVRLASTGTAQSLLETTSWLGLVRILAMFGSAALAGYTIAMRVAVFAMLPPFGLANAAATLVGQNLGAKKPERAEHTVWVVGSYNFVFMGLIGALFVLFPQPIIRFFTTEPAELAYAVASLRIIALGFLFYAWGMVLVAAFNGAGDARTPLLLNVGCFWGVKIPLAYVLAIGLGLGPNGVFMSIALAYSLLAVLAAWLFRRGRWKTQVV